MALNIREVEIFNPYNNEFPEDMLLHEGADEACIDVWREAQLVRIAKVDESIIGIYAMDRLSSRLFYLHGVIVVRGMRHQGLGRWMIGHAIGVAESKGGRQVQTLRTSRTRCFTNIGFMPNGENLQYDLIPE